MKDNLAMRIFIDILMITVGAVLLFLMFRPKPIETVKLDESTNFNIVNSMDQKLKDNSLYIANGNLLLNKFSNMIDGNDKYLDKYKITSVDISVIPKSSYINSYGVANEKYYENLDKKISDKFDIVSDTKTDLYDYQIYSVFYKPFYFDKKFSNLKKDKFNDGDIKLKYFGFNQGAQYKDIFKELFYDDKDNWAVKIISANDEVILYKTSKDKNFLDIYNYILKHSKESEIEDNTSFKMPYIKFKATSFLKMIENNSYTLKDNTKIDRLGAREVAILDITNQSKSKEKIKKGKVNDSTKEYYLDKPFYLFIKLKDQKMPYLALKVRDASLFQ